MSDYKCDICEKKATVHITKFVGGQKLKFHLCQECAEKNQDKLKALIDTQVVLKKKPAQLESVVEDMLGGLKKAPKILICPHCKTSFEEFEKATKVACEHCYEAFSRKFDEILEQIHLSKEHKGIVLEGSKKRKKRPVAKDKAPEDVDLKEVVEEIEEASLEKLNADLALAISQERYEDAALLRDKIKSLKK
ncbi:MAG: UvrB/UvrC motif-containing protein [Opitutales bacterium]